MKVKLGKEDIELGSLMTISTVGFLSDRFNDTNKIKETELFENLTKDKKTLIDVGCAYGALSLIFTTDSSKTAHAVDGSFKSQLALKQTCLLNPEKKIHQYRTLIGKESGIAKCVFDEHQSLMMHDNNTQVHSVESVMSMDDFCETYKVVPDVINIDVEGSEVDVLAGAEKTFVKYRPLIFIEIHRNFIKNFFGKSTMDIYNQFVKLDNYKSFDINMKELVPPRYCIYLDNIAEESVVNIWIPQ